MHVGNEGFPQARWILFHRKEELCAVRSQEEALSFQGPGIYAVNCLPQLLILEGLGNSLVSPTLQAQA